MRVLMAIYGFPPTHVAGAERAAERYANWLTAQGHEVEILAVEDLATPEFRVESRPQNGYLVHRLYYNVFGDDIPDDIMYNYPQIGAAARQILTSGQPFDVVHLVGGYIVGPQVARVARELGLPVVVTVTEYWYLCPRLNLIRTTGEVCSGPESDAKCAACLLEDQRRFRLPAQTAPGLMKTLWKLAEHTPLLDGKTAWVRQRREIVAEVLNQADVVIAPSYFLRRKYTEFGFDTERWVYNWYGIGGAQLSGQPRVYEPADGLRVGYLGQLKPHKGVDLLVDAVIGLLEAGERVQLELWGPEAGAEAYVQKLKQKSAAYPSILWRGVFAGGQVWEKLAQFDVLVVPSRYYENNPTTIMEAQKFGLPVVTANRGSMADLVTHDLNGLLFEADSAADLQRQLARILREPHILERYKQHMPPVPTADEEAAKVYGFYQQALAQHS